MLEYLVIVLGVAVFGVQHSGISALRVKERIIDRWGKSGYSTVFNITSVIALGIAFLSMGFWDWFYFITDPTSIQSVLFVPGIVLVIVGVVISAAASKVISVSTVADMRTDRMPELVTDGIYSRVRHPLYLATNILLVGLALLYPFPEVIVFSISLIVYVMIGAYLEERKLILHYGEEYEKYKQQAGFILPKL